MRNLHFSGLFGEVGSDDITVSVSMYIGILSYNHQQILTFC